MWIIPPFNILEDSEFGLAMIGEAMSVYQLALKGGKEAFWSYPVLVEYLGLVFQACD